MIASSAGSCLKPIRGALTWEEGLSVPDVVFWGSFPLVVESSVNWASCGRSAVRGPLVSSQVWLGVGGSG